MNLTKEAIDLIIQHEGLRLEAYQDPVGVWTIGYGTTTAAGIGVIVTPGMRISEPEARAMLHDALNKFAEKIIPHLARQPTDNQYGAMLSLAYNIGPGAFINSTALRRFNAGDFEGAAEAMTWFNKAGGKVLRGLVRRREAEAKLFLSDDAQSPLPRPDAVRESIAGSTTVLASAGQAAAGVSTAAGAVAMLDGTAQVVALCIAGAVIVLALYIMRERLKKWGGGVR